jgi:PPOX class probable F420-dependent enzyme
VRPDRETGRIDKDRSAAAIDVLAASVDAGRMQRHTRAAPAPSSALAAERYLSLTTFTRAGTPKSTPVWPVDAGDGRVGFISSTKTWKVRRIEAGSRVLVQPSDVTGKVRPNSQSFAGSAQVVVGQAFEMMSRRVSAKYGYQLVLINLLHALPGRRTGHRNDCAVIISLDPS